MPAAWNPPWTLGVRVWYVPVKSNALINLPRAEMVGIAPGRRSSLALEKLCCPAPSGTPRYPHPPFAMDQESVAMTQNTAHFFLLWSLAKLYLGGAQNINISFVFQTFSLT